MARGTPPLISATCAASGSRLPSVTGRRKARRLMMAKARATRATVPNAMRKDGPLMPQVSVDAASVAIEVLQSLVPALIVTTDASPRRWSGDVAAPVARGRPVVPDTLGGGVGRQVGAPCLDA